LRGHCLSEDSISGQAGRLVAEFGEREGVVAVEPPVVAVVRRQRRQEVELVLLAGGAAGDSDQAQLVGREADHQSVPRPAGDVASHGVERRGGFAADQHVEDRHLAGVPVGRCSYEVARRRDGFAGAGNVAA
jgi:hypothetical protein